MSGCCSHPLLQVLYINNPFSFSILCKSVPTLYEASQAVTDLSFLASVIDGLVVGVNDDVPFSDLRCAVVAVHVSAHVVISTLLASPTLRHCSRSASAGERQGVIFICVCFTLSAMGGNIPGGLIWFQNETDACVIAIFFFVFFTSFAFRSSFAPVPKVLYSLNRVPAVVTRSCVPCLAFRHRDIVRVVDCLPSLAAREGFLPVISDNVVVSFLLFGLRDHCSFGAWLGH